MKWNRIQDKPDPDPRLYEKDWHDRRLLYTDGKCVFCGTYNVYQRAVATFTHWMPLPDLPTKEESP